MKSAWIFVVVAWAAAAQSQPQGTQPAPKGVESEWDLRTRLDTLSAGARRLQPIIAQADPKTWRDPQAGQSYIPQWQAAQNEIRYLNGTVEKLAKDPERLTLVLEAYFRLQAVESSVKALVEGIHKYHNPAVADLLQSALVENMNNREHLKTYLFDLAQTKEQEFAIMDKEAQRCRGMLDRQTPPAKARPRSK